MTRVPRGHSSRSRGCANKLLIIIKRFLFTTSKNINHSPSYEQSKNRTSITNLFQHVHVRVTMYPLTTISYITHSVVNTPIFYLVILNFTKMSWERVAEIPNMGIKWVKMSNFSNHLQVANGLRKSYILARLKKKVKLSP